VDLPDYFRMLARYNRIANERVFERCSLLDEAEYRKERRGSLGSIHGLLNHILLGDRIWMARFEGEGRLTPALALQRSRPAAVLSGLSSLVSAGRSAELWRDLGKDASLWEEQSCRYPSSCGT